MNTRAYVLLDIADGKSEQVALTLRDMPGVLIADCLEGSPDILVMVEASDRRRLAELLMPVLSTLDNVTDDLRLLVSRDMAVPVLSSL